MFNFMNFTNCCYFDVMVICVSPGLYSLVALCCLYLMPGLQLPPLLATAFGAALPKPARALLGASAVRPPAFCRCCSPPTPLTSQNRALLVCTPVAVVVAVMVNVVPNLDQDERLHNSPQLHQHSLSKHTLDSPHAIDLGHLCPTFPDTTSAAACCLPLPTSPLRPCYHRSTQVSSVLLLSL